MAALRTRRARRFLSIARRGARTIARERMPWSDPLGLLVRAGVVYLEGDSRLAAGDLYDAADRFDRADMKLHAAVARRCIAAVQNDGAARDLRRQAERWMAAQHIRNPVAMTRMLAPGFPDLA
jgi:hypothetical protein